MAETILASMSLSGEYNNNLQKDGLNLADSGMRCSVKGEYSITGYRCCFWVVSLKLG